MKQPIYLDYAAATPMDEAAVLSLQPYLTERFYNPSATYLAARRVQADLTAARQKAAQVLGAQPQEIIFTAGGTEANNLATHGIMKCWPDGHLVTLGIEHDSVLRPVQNYSHTLVPVGKTGIAQVDDVMAAVTDRTVLLSVMYANNEVGTVQRISELAQRIAMVRQARQKAGNRRPLYLHSDACQAANYLDLQVSRLGVDLMTLNGGKIYAAKQSGCLYIRSGVKIGSYIEGGGQERAIRSGTENVASVQAFATMLQTVQTDRKAESQRIRALRDKLLANLSQKIPTLIVNGDLKHRLPNNLHITIPNVDGERLVMELDESGIMAATGSACSASNDEPSHVLLALGHSTAEASASLRLTLGRPTTEGEVTEAVNRIADTVRKHLELV